MDEPPRDDWPGVLEPSLLSKDTVTAGHRLADAADAGDWPALFDLLDADPALSANQWRPGSPDWLTPLHQAAHHGAPADVVAALLDRGALRFAIPGLPGAVRVTLRCGYLEAASTLQTHVISHRGAVPVTDGMG